MVPTLGVQGKFLTTYSFWGGGGDCGRGESRPNPDSTPLSSSLYSSPSSSTNTIIKGGENPDSTQLSSLYSSPSSSTIHCPHLQVDGFDDYS